MCSNIRREGYKEISMAEPLLSSGTRRAASAGVLLSLTDRRCHGAVSASQRQARSVAPAAAPAAAARGQRGRRAARAAPGASGERRGGPCAPLRSSPHLTAPHLTAPHLSAPHRSAALRRSPTCCCPPRPRGPAAVGGAGAGAGGAGMPASSLLPGPPWLQPSHRHSWEEVGEAPKPKAV